MTTKRNTVATIVTLAAIVAVTAIACIISYEFAIAVTTPCLYEDSSTCHWFATERGNGTGRSFLNLFGITFYLP